MNNISSNSVQEIIIAYEESDFHNIHIQYVYNHFHYISFKYNLVCNKLITILYNQLLFIKNVLLFVD